MNQWKLRRTKYKKDKYGHILGVVEEESKVMETSNAFEALNQEQNGKQEESFYQ